jgi:hypothetical protein
MAGRSWVAFIRTPLRRHRRYRSPSSDPPPNPGGADDADIFSESFSTMPNKPLRSL